LNFRINKIINKCLLLMNRSQPVTAYIVLACFALVILVLMPVGLVIRHRCFNESGDYVGCIRDIENPQPLPTGEDSDSENEVVHFLREPEQLRNDTDVDGTIVLPKSVPTIPSSTSSSVLSAIRAKYNKLTNRQRPQIQAKPIPTGSGLNSPQQPHTLHSSPTPEIINNPAINIDITIPKTVAFINPTSMETSQLTVVQSPRITTSMLQDKFVNKLATTDNLNLSSIHNTDNVRVNLDSKFGENNTGKNDMTQGQSTTPLATDSGTLMNRTDLLADISDDSDDGGPLPAQIWAAINLMCETTPTTSSDAMAPGPSSRLPTSPYTTAPEAMNMTQMNALKCDETNERPASYYETQFDQMARSRSNTPDKD
jgi:hypothetical protein